MADVALEMVKSVILSTLVEEGVKYILSKAGEAAKVVEATKVVVKETYRKLNGNVANMNKEEVSNTVTKVIGKVLKNSFKKELIGVKDEHMSQLIKEELNKATDKQDSRIEEIIKYYTEISKIEEKIDDSLILGCEENDRVNVELYFSRPLTEEEKSEFLDPDSLTEAYDPKAIEFTNLNIDSDSVALGFDGQEASKFEVARFALFIDKYLRNISSDLYIRSIVLM